MKKEEVRLTKPLAEMSYFDLIKFLNKKYGKVDWRQKEFIQWESIQGKLNR